MRTTHDTPSTNPISVDLLESARRSDNFPKDWDDQRRERALRRYAQFLVLASRHPGQRLAPTRDIDEMWHLHMLSPRAYLQDCQRLFGQVFDHDGGFGKGEGELPQLIAIFEETAKLWEQEFNEPYVETSATGDGAEKCWHDCSGRCWHACAK